jgi:hypothetical protein
MNVGVDNLLCKWKNAEKYNILFIVHNDPEFSYFCPTDFDIEENYSMEHSWSCEGVSYW